MIDDRWLAAKLKARGLVNQAQIDAALADRSAGLCQHLVENEVVEESEILKFLGIHFQTRYITAERLTTADIPDWVLKLLPVEFCEEHLVLPVRCNRPHSTLSVITADPGDDRLLNRIKNLTKLKEIQAFVALPHAVSAAIGRFYGRGVEPAADRGDSGPPADPLSEKMPADPEAAADTGVDEDPETSIGLRSPGTSEDLVSLGQKPEPPPAEPQRPSADQLAAAVPLLERQVALVRALVNHAELEHGWRRGHSVDLARLVQKLAQRAGMSEEETAQLRLATLLHELGRPLDTHLTLLGMEAQKEQRKLAEEVRLMPNRLLEGTGVPAAILDLLGLQFVRPDGEGVPAGETNNPLGARILAAADAYLDLLNNPNAPGDRCPDRSAALRRLREAAEENILCFQSVGLLSQVLSGDSLREELLEDRHAVLLVDQDEEAHHGLIQQLNQHGIDVRLAGNTAMAARLLLAGGFDLIISEMQLEPVNGLGFLERLRTNQRTSKIPFIFLSEQAASEQVDAAFEMGVEDYIPKPYRTGLVVAKVRQVLRGRSPAAPGSFRSVAGSLSEMPLLEILQVMTSVEKTGQLTLQMRDKTGRIYLDKGKVVHAQLGTKLGEEAFFEMVGIPEGEFTLDPTAISEEHAIDRSTDSLLREARKRRSGG
jgi:response regulator RpfG family c-di-GMP phosphodiesterase